MVVHTRKSEKEKDRKAGRVGEEIAKQKASALLSVFTDKKPTAKGDESSTEQLDAANETIKKLKQEISNLKSQGCYIRSLN